MVFIVKTKKKHLKKRYKIILFLLLILAIIPQLFPESKTQSEVNAKTSEKSKNELKITETSAFPDNVYGVPVYTELIDEGIARPTTKRLVKYIVLHETDNFINGVGAKNHATYLKNNNESSTSWHYTNDDHEIYHHNTR